jgi:pectinesterase
MAISLSHFTSATNRNSPPAGSLIVGSSGTYKTISAAVAAASEGDSIFVYAGTYKEAVYITVDNLNLWPDRKHIILHVEHSHHNIWWLSGNERE